MTKVKFPSCHLYSGTGLAYHNGQFARAGGFVPEMIELASYFDEFTIYAPVFSVDNLEGMDLFPDHIHIHPLKPSKSFFHHLLTMPINAFRIYRSLTSDAATLCYVPNIVPLGTIAAILAKVKRINAVLCVRGSLIRTLRQNKKLNRFKRQLLLIEHVLFTKVLFILYKHDPVFVAGHHDADKAKSEGLTNAIGFHPLLKPLPSKGTSKRKPGHLLFVGRIEAAKGVYELLEATEKLLQLGYSLELCFIGKECDNGKAREKALQLKDNFRDFSFEFKSTIQYGDILFEEYQKADIFVLPSYSEGFPKVIVEALCAGAVVIASNIGGIQEIICHGENGFLVQPGSSEDLFNALKNILDDPDLKETIRQKGIAYSEQFHHMEPFKTIALTAIDLVQKNNS